MTQTSKRPAPASRTRARPSQRRAPARTAREIALDALIQVIGTGESVEQALAQHQNYRKLETRDRGFARALCASAMRHKGLLEKTYHSFLETPLPESANKARAVLLLAAADLIILETPAHAGVDGGVRLMGRDPQTFKYKRLANAVLRKVADEGPALFREMDRLDNLPDWITARWIAHYGEDITRAMIEAAAKEPSLDLTVKPKETLEDWAQRLDATALPTGSLRRYSIGDVTQLPGFDEGVWWVQDSAAALPVKLLQVQAGERVGDICAAPGGKTLQLASLGADVTALDRSKKRLERLKSNLARTGLSAHIVTADATTWEDEEKFDALLIDAPCSATGTLRKNPEVVWSKSESDIETLAALQARILDHAVSLLKPQGRMVYCTCSLEPEEGEQQINAFLARTPGIELDPITPSDLPELS